MNGLAAFAFAIVAFCLVAEATWPGVIDATTRATAALTWAAGHDLEGRLALATAEAERLAGELQ